MLKKTSGLMLSLLLVSTLTLVFIQPAKATGGTIYIRADSSVDPPTAPIQRNGDIYTFTDNIYDSIVVERSNIIIDGAGYTLQGLGVQDSNGICVTGRTNVTIRNVEIKAFGVGIYLDSSSNSIISTNNLTSNSYPGIWLEYSSYSNIAANEISNNGLGIWARSSSNNIISTNNITANDLFGICLIYSSDYNRITGNDIVATNFDGIRVDVSSNNIISRNNVTNNGGDGIELDSSSYNNTIVKNNITKNMHFGITLSRSSGRNNISENNIAHNDCGIRLLDSSDNNAVFHNNLVSNMNQTNLSGSYNNVWDDEYPSGGNYWSDYSDVDLNNDGIWDHPYVIDANNTDRYPLVNPWTPAPPPKFSIGDWVQTTANLNVREGPGLGYAIIDTMPEGTLGQIVDGPVEADGYIWWDVDYVVGVRGWSAQNWLELASPNQPPVADFTFYPQHPKAGEEVTFDASPSYDLDGEVVFYEWDWNGDGDFDDYTASPTITFWWLEKETYNVSLRVIDDKGAVCITSKEITVSKSATSETMIVLASIWDYPRFGWDTTRALNQIDRYMGLDWIKPYNKADLAYLLDKEVDPDQAPNLNYKTFVRSKIFEEELVNEAFRFYISVSHQVSKHIFKYVLDSVWKLGVQITLDGVMMLHPLVGAGLKTIYLGVQMYSLSEAFKRINQYWYYLGLAEYWFWRPDSSPEAAWSESVSKWVNKAITTREVPLAEGQKIKTLEETKFYFEELWQEYGDKGDFGVGLYEKFRQDNREQLKNLLLSKLRETFGARELVDRTIVHVSSPVELRVYDFEGRITGVINGEEKAEIPNSVYDSETKTVTIFLPSDSLRYEVAGTGAGTYGLEITCMENGQIINFTATNIPTSPNTIHQYTTDWDALSMGEEGVTVMVDSDGDGVFEHTFTSDSELTQSEFLAQTAPPPLSVSVSPLSASILVGQSVTFTSTVSGGYTPYSYRWYLNSAPVSSATLNMWIFTPTTGGIYYVYLKVTDAKGNTAQSQAARIVVATVPVGGYSVPIQLPTTAKPVTPYIALLTILTAMFITIKRKAKRKH